MNLLGERRNKYLFSIILLNLIQASVNAFIGITLIYIINTIMNHADAQIIERYMLFVSIGIVIICIIYPMLYLTYNYCGRKAIADLRKKYFEHLASLPVNILDDMHSGSILFKVSNDISVVEEIIISSITKFVYIIISTIIVVIAMLTINFYISITIIVLTITLITINKIYSKSVKKLTAGIQSINSKLTESIVNEIAGLETIYVFNINDKVYEKNIEAAQKLKSLSLKRGRKYSIISASNHFTSMLIFVIVIFIGIITMLKGKNNFAVIVGLVQLQMNLNYSLSSLSNLTAKIKSSFISLERIEEFLSEPVEREDVIDSCANDMEHISKNENKSVEIKDVSYSYKNRKGVLEKINLEVNYGAKVSIVGHSGSGKSTIIKLLMGLYEDFTGDIYIEGKSIRNYKLSELRNKITYIPQDPQLLNTTIEENIRYGSLNATKEEIIKAAKLAGAHDFILETADGYNTVINWQGNNLSGGQKQRIAIARAFLKNAPIVIMDEATASLDAETEDKIQNSLEILLQGKTAITVVHRLNTVINSDCIYVVENGNIAGMGSHSELLSENSIYQQLYKDRVNNLS